MKNSAWLPVLACLLTNASMLTASAMPYGPSDNGKEYLLGSSDWPKWSTGFYYQYRERDLTPESGFGKITTEEDRLLAYLGYQILPFAVLYAQGGEMDSEFTGSNLDTQDFAWGGTLQLNFLNQELLDPTLIEDKLRITATVSYLSTTVEDNFGEEDPWYEVGGTLIVSLVNDIRGNKLFLPEHIALYGGAVYADISSDRIDSGEERFGYLGGIEFLYLPRTSFYFQVEQIDEMGFGGGLNIRF